VLDGILAWLTGLPPAALYVALALIAAFENIFPPLPADTIVAFGAFLAARGDASLTATVLATWGGNVAGALIMYAIGRRLSGDALRRRLAALGDGGAIERFTTLYERYGAFSVFVSRFLPGVRAIVPPVAGALRIRAGRTAFAIAAASAIWYGGVAVVAYRVGANWEELQRALGSMGRWAALTALALTLATVAGVMLWRRRRRA
jgi:membrane protein DedA with SNARE-associated domain